MSSREEKLYKQSLGWLVGKTITAVGYSEVWEMPTIAFDDGEIAVISQDSEGNGPGDIWCIDPNDTGEE